MAQSNPDIESIFTDVANSIRGKTGSSELIHPVDFADNIDSIETGGSYLDTANIHFSTTTEPENKTALWIKSEKPSLYNVSVTDSRVVSYSSEVVATTLPYYMSGMATAAIDNIVYLAGASYLQNGYRRVSSYIYRFNTTTKTFMTSVTMPGPLAGASAAAIDKVIYIFGGYDTASPTSYLDTILMFDTTTDTITTLDITLPITVSSLSTAVVGTNIYLFGGQTKTSSSTTLLDTILKFDTIANTITQLDVTLPTASYAYAAEVVGTNVYLLGGYSSINSGTYLDTILKFDTTTNTLTTLSTKLIHSRSGCGHMAAGTKIYVCGGISKTSSTVYLKSVEEFDTTTETITELSPTLASVQTSHSTASVDTKMWLFGGAISSSTSTDYIQYYDISEPLLKSMKAFITSTDRGKYVEFNTVDVVVEAKVPYTCYYCNENKIVTYIKMAIYKTDTNQWTNVN